MTPFCAPNYNIHASYVGATYHVARNYKSQRQRTTRLVAPVYVNRVALATRRLTILRERGIPGTFSLPPSGYKARFRCATFLHVLLANKTDPNTRPTKNMTPFCLPNYNIKTSYVGATGGQCRRAVSTRPTRPARPEVSEKESSHGATKSPPIAMGILPPCGGGTEGGARGGLKCRCQPGLPQLPIWGGTPPSRIHTVSILLPKKGAK